MSVREVILRSRHSFVLLSAFALACGAAGPTGSSAEARNRAVPENSSSSNSSEPADEGGYASYVTDVRLLPSDEVWVTVSQPSGLRSSHDLGETWTTVLETPESGFVGMGPSDGKPQVVIGQDGGVWRSGSGSWTKNEADLGEAIRATAWAGGAIGLAVGIDAVIQRTSDGGASWDRVVVEDQETLNGATFSANGRAWVVGNRGLILHSGDSGLSWTRQKSGARETLFAVSFADGEHGWCVGRSGLVLVTKDGGKSWERRPVGVEATLFSVQALSDRLVVVAGDSGVCRVSRDGGATWETVDSGSAADWRAVRALEDGRLLLGGSDETVVITKWR